MCVCILNMYKICKVITNNLRQFEISDSLHDVNDKLTI
jgi:hypothetical protein